MATEVFDNAGAAGTLTYLVDPLISTDGELQVQGPASTELQQAGGQFRAIITNPITKDQEIVLVTDGAFSATWTVDRAVDDTTAKDFPVGSTVRHILTRDGLKNLIGQGGGGGAGGGQSVTNAALALAVQGITYATPTGMDDFPSGNSANAVACQSDGKSVLSGALKVNGVSYLVIARFTRIAADWQLDLQLDSTFGQGGFVLVRTTDATSMGQQGFAIQSDGKIISSGTAIGPSGEQAFVCRVNSNGTLDTSFGGTGRVAFMPKDSSGNPAGAAIAFACRADSSGNVYVAGGATVEGITSQNFITKILANGTIDTSYGNQGTRIVDATPLSGAIWNLRIDSANRVVFGAQGKIGYSTVGSGDNPVGTINFKVASLGAAQPNGIVNGVQVTIGSGPTQETNIVVSVDHTGSTMQLAVPTQNDHPDGTAVAVAYDVMTVGRLTPSGALDTTFNGSGFNNAIWGLAALGFTMDFQSDEKIICTGGGFVTGSQVIVARFKTDGTIDTSFGPNGDGAVYPNIIPAGVNGAVIQPDDKIVVANVDAGATTSVAMRFLANGQLDQSFGVGGNVRMARGAYVVPNGVAIDPIDNSIILGGVGTPVGGKQTFAISRLTPTGKIADQGLPDVPFAQPPAQLPAPPAANGAVSQPSTASQSRTAWAAITGDGAKTQYTVLHNLSSVVRARGYEVAGGSLGTERILSYAANPLDPLSSVLVNFPTPLPAGVSLFILMEA